jgi:citrate lyase subunit beta/citryl-CoA lyase
VSVIARSYLYVPGDRPDRFPKALESGADAVVFDLEDAVPLATKDEARSLVAEALSTERGSGAEAWVRINTGSRGLDDLKVIASICALTGVFVPKATSASLGEALSAVGGARVCALVESALGALQMAAMTGLDGVSQLALGEVDLVADLAMSPSPDGRELWPIRLDAVVASAAHGCSPPVGPVWVDIRDLEGLASSTEALRRAGFGARQAIHPTQVSIINKAMSPTPEDLERAAHLLELAEQAGGGACVDDDGRMIDEAVLRSARRLLATVRPR